MTQMIDFIADAQIKPLAFAQSDRFFDAPIEMFQGQSNIRVGRFHAARQVFASAAFDQLL